MGTNGGSAIPLLKNEMTHLVSSWFDGGLTNVCFNALDRHVQEGKGDRTALIYDSPVTVTDWFLVLPSH